MARRPVAHLRELVLVELKGGDGFAKRYALLAVGQHGLETIDGRPGDREGDAEACVVENRQGTAQTTAFR